MRSQIFLTCFASFMVKHSSFSQPDGISITLLKEDLYNARKICISPRCFLARFHNRGMF